MFKSVIKYFSKNPSYNSIVHLLLGIGLGILITRPFVGVHPVRVAVIFISLGILGHLYPLINKVK